MVDHANFTKVFFMADQFFGCFFELMPEIDNILRWVGSFSLIKIHLLSNKQPTIVWVLNDNVVCCMYLCFSWSHVVWSSENKLLGKLLSNSQTWFKRIFGAPPLLFTTIWGWPWPSFSSKNPKGPYKSPSHPTRDSRASSPVGSREIHCFMATLGVILHETVGPWK